MNVSLIRGRRSRGSTHSAAVALPIWEGLFAGPVSCVPTCRPYGTLIPLGGELFFPYRVPTGLIHAATNPSTAGDHV
jgi:hypothetical protein